MPARLQVRDLVKHCARGGMRLMSSMQSRQALVSSPLFQPWIGYAVAAAVLAAGWVVHGGGLLNHDVAWLNVAAGRMLHGGGYLRDFFEVNMPLAIAAYIPSFSAAGFFHVPEQMVVTWYVCLLAVQAAGLSGRVLSTGPVAPLSRAFAPWFGAWLLLGFLFLPAYDFGQRDHLIVLLGLPFVCAMANYEGLRARSTPERIYIALLAAIGCFLKPYYAGLPFLLLGAAAAARRSWAPLRSLELAVLLVAAAANSALVLLLYPDWFVVARWAADLYIDYGRDGQVLYALFHVPGVAPALLSLGLQLLVFLRIRGTRPLLGPLLLATFYAWGAYLAQQKGWTYQFLPVLLLTWAGQMLALAACALAMGKKLAGRLLLVCVAAASLLLSSVAVGRARGLPKVAALQGLPNYLSLAQPGESVFAFSLELVPYFPAVELVGLNWGSRYSHLWPLLELARAEHLADFPDAARLERTYRAPLVAAVIEDFRRYQPRLVFVDRRTKPAAYDIQEIFLADPQFAAIWRDYVYVDTIRLADGRPLFEIYRRNSAPPAAQ